jgi:gliding motility-associated-like protein
MYVCIADRVRYSTDAIGAYFSTGAVSLPNGGVLPYTPQIFNTSGILQDTANWVQISGTFIAQGGENFITIGSFVNDANTNSIYSNSSGWYSNNCFYVDKVNLHLVNTIATDTTICENDTIQISVSANFGTPPYTYSWTGGLPATAGPHNVSPLVTTNYIVTVTDSVGTIINDTATVIVLPRPIVNLGNDTTLCKGNILLLNATNLYTIYLWQNSSTDSTFTVTQQGTYWVKVSLQECFAYDTIVVAESPVYTINNDAVTICHGDSVLIYGDYQSVAGDYYDSLNTINNCDSVIITELTVMPLLDVNLGKDTVLEYGKEIILDAGTGFENYFWNDSSKNQTLLVNEGGTYYVIVTGANGCQKRDEIIIIPAETGIIIYNTFTPNGDGKNDTWYIKNIDLYSDNKIGIYNRNGDLVYKANNYQNNWDGRYNGENLPAATYYYIIYLAHNPEVYKGNVTIVR